MRSDTPDIADAVDERASERGETLSFLGKERQLVAERLAASFVEAGLFRYGLIARAIDAHLAERQRLAADRADKAEKLRVAEEQLAHFENVLVRERSDLGIFVQANRPYVSEDKKLRCLEAAVKTGTAALDAAHDEVDRIAGELSEAVIRLRGHPEFGGLQYRGYGSENYAPTGLLGRCVDLGVDLVFGYSRSMAALDKLEDAKGKAERAAEAARVALEEAAEARAAREVEVLVTGAEAIAKRVKELPALIDAKREERDDLADALAASAASSNDNALWRSGNGPMIVAAVIARLHLDEGFETARKLVRTISHPGPAKLLDMLESLETEMADLGRCQTLEGPISQREVTGLAGTSSSATRPLVLPS
jgi:hypothetical protein